MNPKLQTSRLYVIAAPSGAGKSSLVNALLEKVDNVVLSISYTTRPQRPGEIDGQHYHFIDRAQFERMIAAGEFLEYAQVFAKVADYYYGTGRQWVEQQLAMSKNVILEIDWQGAEQIFKQFPAAVGIFILPPSLAILEQRLKKRARDDEETIRLRMSVAKDEIAHYQDYHYVIVNNDFEVALNELIAIFNHSKQVINKTNRKLTPALEQLIAELLA